MTPDGAIDSFRHVVQTTKRPSGWNLAVDDVENVIAGTLVLADVDIECVPECSIGVVTECLANYLYQVVFASPDWCACLVVPVEALCIAGSYDSEEGESVCESIDTNSDECNDYHDKQRTRSSDRSSKSV